MSHDIDDHWYCHHHTHLLSANCSNSGPHFSQVFGFDKHRLASVEPTGRNKKSKGCFVNSQTFMYTELTGRRGFSQSDFEGFTIASHSTACHHLSWRQICYPQIWNQAVPLSLWAVSYWKVCHWSCWLSWGLLGFPLQKGSSWAEILLCIKGWAAKQTAHHCQQP